MVTLVEGSSFCVCAPSGLILAELPHGVFFSDTRFLSKFELLVDGRRPGSAWATGIQLTTFIDDQPVAPLYPCGEPVERAQPAARFRRWRRAIPVLATPHDVLRSVVARSAEDLGALRIFDPEFPDRP